MKSAEINKTALILGATSDIGIQITNELLHLGWNVQITGKNQNLLNQITNDLKSKYQSEITSLYLDISDTKRHSQFVKNLKMIPDIVFSCIGYYEDQTLAKNDSDEFLKTIQINFTGIAILLNCLTLEMEKNKKGKVVVLSSVAGLRGRQLNFIYGSAKAALTTYLSGLRNLLHPHIQITTILLGPVYTKMSAGHKLIPWITLQPKDAAKKIIRAGLNGKDEVYIHWIWKYIMLGIRLIPEWIFKKLPPF